MYKELLSFNIRLKSGNSIVDFLKIAAKISRNYDFNSILYEFNTDIEKCIYQEKEFKQFEEFEKYYTSNSYRFDSLNFKKEKDYLHIGFQQSRGELRVFGRLQTRAVFDEILLLTESNILYAYLHNSLDMFLSRTDKVRSWKRKLNSLPDYIKTYKNPRFGSGERDEFLIDLETVPTHQHFILTGDKLWFGACAEMYFSDIYYKYINESKWNKVDNCAQNKVLSSGLRKIKLYDEFELFEKADNRSKQWLFREVLGIDEVAHNLKKQNLT